MKKIALVSVLLGLSVVLAGCAQTDTGPYTSQEPSADAADTQAVTPDTGKTFTMEEVSKHADRSSCYTVIRGDVFDLTKAIDTHPGGPQRILALCGKDGTDAFVDKHGGKPRQENALQTFKIGALAK